MSGVHVFKSKKAVYAAYIGCLCSIAYLAVYFARNVLGAVTPKMLENGFSTQYIGRASSIYFITYAVGQLINGSIGDRIKARYMVSVGLLMAGCTNLLFSQTAALHPDFAIGAYGMTGFFLAMIYGPITKLVAENTEEPYTHRCSLGYTFSSFFGTPLAGMAAAVMTWQSVFFASTATLAIMSVGCFCVFLLFERKGLIRHHIHPQKKGGGGSIRLLFQHQIVRFTIVSILTGVIRTTVIFWIPTYIAQYLGFSAETSSLIFTAASFVISLTAFIAIFIYEKIMHFRRNPTVLLLFTAAAVFFSLLFVVKQPVLNIILLVAAIMSSNGVATILWSVYCPSLADTGMVSGTTGFLDFFSYVAASVSSTLFANAIDTIGWQNLILIWMLLMVVGVLLFLPYRNIRRRLFKKTAA